MTLLKDNNYKEINVALLSLEADIKNKITGFDTSEIDKQLAEINSRIDKINAGGGSSSSDEIEDINSKLNSNSIKIRNIEQNIEDIDTQINGIEQKLSDIFSAENKVTDFNTTTNSGIYYWLDDAANKPCDYGVLLVNKYDGGDSATRLWINQIAYGTNKKIYFRQNINSIGWTEWKAVAFDGEITAYKVSNALTINGKTYDGSTAVDAGVQTVANGGTGVTTQADINKAFIGNLDTGESDVTDGTEFVSSYASDNGFAETAEGALNKPYKRQFIKVWNYIKDKIGSVLGLTASNYGGTSATILDYVKGTPIKVRWGGPGIDSAEWYPAFSADGSAIEPINRNNIHAGKADKVASEGVSTMWIYGRAEAICKTTSAAGGSGWKTLASIKTASGSIEIGNLSGEDSVRVVYSSDADVNAGINNVTQLLYIRRGNIESPHELIANSAKASNKMVIPIGAPSQLEDGCIWIER